MRLYFCIVVAYVLRFQVKCAVYLFISEQVIVLMKSSLNARGVPIILCMSPLLEISNNFT